MATDSVVVVSLLDGMATVILNKPEKRNAMDGVMVQELIRVLQELANHPAVHVLILKAHGEHFCAGADMAWMQKMSSSSLKENIQDAKQLALLMQLLYTFPKPVVVLAQGATFGGGLGLLSAADIVIAADNATFAFSEVKIGLVPSVISPYVIAAIGGRAARYYFLTAMRFGASEAHRIGLIHQVVEPEALAAVGLSLARDLATHSPQAMREAKQLIRRVSQQDVSPDVLQFTAEHLATMRTFADAKEGLQAFLEKRTPKWS